jgi:hypothetical protein
MAEGPLHPILRLAAVRNLLIDRLAGEIAGAFAAAGIDTLVLKGPVLAAWLYPGEVRPYGDADLLVSPADWDRAVALLEQLGFSDHLGPMAHPRMESMRSTAFLRGEDNVDLHGALHGLDADPAAIWAAFREGAQRQAIGDAELLTPRRAPLVLHVALHASHHGEGKALEDLRRALAAAGDDTWREALALALALDGVAAFASGLRLIPEGEAMAQRLGVEHERAVRYELRREDVPTAEALDALFAPGVSGRTRVATIAHELAPRAEFMRWWTPLARRGRLGLLLSYPWRWLWLAAHAPRGALAVVRARRRLRG